VWNTHHRPADARASCQQSIADLGCSYLDLLLVHWPEAWLAGSTLEAPQADAEVTIQQTW
jgi:diketogulonate reductase-like aldo/keto reductase